MTSLSIRVSAQSTIDDDDKWDSHFGAGQALGEWSVNAVHVTGDTMYVAGVFDEVGGVRAVNIAMYDKRTGVWSSLGTDSSSGPNGHLTTLAMHDGDLYVGGTFTAIAGIPAHSVARWDGSQWHAVGNGFMGTAHVQSLVVYRDSLYVAGGFTKGASIQ